MNKNEFKLRIESLLKSKNYWLLNNALNFIDSLLKDKSISKEITSEILIIKNEVEKIEDGSIKRCLNKEPENLIKINLLKIYSLLQSI